MTDIQPRVELIDISKAFRGVHALKNVSFSVLPGEIHALVGENGAGKSTLMKILSGAYQRDTGAIKIDGQQVEIRNPHDGRQQGVGIIYQEFALATDLTVAENLFIKHLGSGRGIVRWAELYRKADELIRSVGFVINPRLRVRDLSVAYQQMVEITKEFAENVKILVLDEPTAVLAPKEVEQLFQVLRRLKSQGMSFVHITHRLDEVFQIADRITVLKDGEVVGTVVTSEVSKDDIINMMIGRKLSTMYPERETQIGGEVLAIKGLSLADSPVQDVSFSVRAGEVLGIAGLVGSGRTEVARAIFGAERVAAGEIVIDGKRYSISSPRAAVRAGLGLVPEDRKNQGVILPMTVRANTTMPSLDKVTRMFGIFRARVERALVSDLIAKLSIKTAGMDVDVADLSGGNQQKVALAKWLSKTCKVLILDEPTRGVDVGAKVEIYTLINALAAQGLGIVMISSEMMEVIGMADRVMVMSQGRVAGFLEGDEVTEENILRLSIKHQSSAAPAPASEPQPVAQQ
ncbi:MAG: sugar ABC transporter ATP-binding protein [Anaerolineae bacterium]|nr:sugar ABC transporter ATP-binding protein [Anaerolineae bacterium]